MTIINHEAFLMQFSAASSYFLLPKVKYFPHYSVIECLQPVLFFESDRPDFLICIKQPSKLLLFFSLMFVYLESKGKKIIFN
jgi:hypothetical protein